MAAKEVSLSSRTARLKLEPRHNAYFRRISGGHVGYFKPVSPHLAGTWHARAYSAGRYVSAIIGAADDIRPADGHDTLSFDQAAAKAALWVRDREAAARPAAPEAPTVRTAIEAYVRMRKLRSVAAGTNAERRLSHHVLHSPLADKRISDVTDADLEDWRAGLQRGGRGQPSDKALSPATVARLLNDARAAISAAARKVRVSADVLTSIKDGLRSPEQPDQARPAQIINDADVRKIIAAATSIDSDFGALVLVLAASGARFDQVARLTVADFQAKAGRLMLPVSRKGRGIRLISHVARHLPDDVIDRLRPLVVGRAPGEPLLMRWHHQQVPGDKGRSLLPRWERVERRPWSDGQMPRPWRAAVAAAGLPPDLVPYCLRHSSIVRALHAGLPVQLVAAQHDTSALMIAKHYAAFISDASEAMLRRAVVPMVT